jgi:hypothetical protein
MACRLIRQNDRRCTTELCSQLAGQLLVCDTADKIKETAGTDNFEQAFIRIVKGVAT